MHAHCACFLSWNRLVERTLLDDPRLLLLHGVRTWRNSRPRRYSNRPYAHSYHLNQWLLYIVAVGPNELSTIQGVWPGCSCYVRPLAVLLREAVLSSVSVLHGLFGSYRYHEVQASTTQRHTTAKQIHPLHCFGPTATMYSSH